MSRSGLNTLAVVLEAPERMALTRVELSPPGDDDLVVDVEWSGISTGTEKLLWSGRMPAFPGMGYPLIPGYESVGRVLDAGAHANNRIGERVFVPGARCFGPIRGLFGGAAARVVVPAARTVTIDDGLGEQGVLLALAATAYHAIAAPSALPPELIVGHGVLGRLLARVSLAMGNAAPVVWERDARRTGGAAGYQVVEPGADSRRDYRSVCDVSGDAAIIDALTARLAPRGEITLAGFYAERVSFDFAPAFMREVRVRVAAEWQPADLVAVQQLVASGKLSLAGLITHREAVADAPEAYRTAFTNPDCLKMVLDWRRLS
jgi:bacteriochlorophyllide a dehydrogenase